MFIDDYCERLKYNRKQHGYSFFYQYWREILFEYACKIFSYKGEIAKKIPPKEIESRLLMFGKCGVNRDKNGKLIATNVNLYGISEYFDQFPYYNFTTPLESDKRTIGVDAVLIDNNSIRNDLMSTIHAYSCQLAHAEVTLISALINSRDTVAWTAINDRMAQSAREYRAKMYEGKIDVCVDKGFSTVEMRPLSTDKRQSFTEIYDVRNNILNSYLELIGVRRANDKRERLIVDEVNANDALLKVNLTDMRDARLTGLKEIERVFGVTGELVCNVDIDGNGELDDNEEEREDDNE